MRLETIVVEACKQHGIITFKQMEVKMVPTKEEVLAALRNMRKWQEGMEAESLVSKELESEDVRQQADMFISIHRSLYELLEKHFKIVDYDQNKINALNADILNQIGMMAVTMEIATAAFGERDNDLIVH